MWLRLGLWLRLGSGFDAPAYHVVERRRARAARGERAVPIDLVGGALRRRAHVEDLHLLLLVRVRVRVRATVRVRVRVGVRVNRNRNRNPNPNPNL